MSLLRATILSAILLASALIVDSRTVVLGTDSRLPAFSSPRIVAMSCLESPATVRHSNPTLTLSGSSSSGGTLSGLVENVSAPVVPNQDPPATVVVRINGWIIDSPRLEWDDEEQAWKFASIKFDEDHIGAVVTITVTDTLTGTTTTQTITIT